MITDQLQPIRSGETYAYRYHAAILPNSRRAHFKGRVVLATATYSGAAQPQEFRFYACNDADAYAYLLGAFAPHDPRLLASGNKLSFSRSGPIRLFWCNLCRCIVYGDVVECRDDQVICPECGRALGDHRHYGDTKAIP